MPQLYNSKPLDDLSLNPLKDLSGGRRLYQQEPIESNQNIRNHNNINLVEEETNLRFGKEDLAACDVTRVDSENSKQSRSLQEKEILLNNSIFLSERNEKNQTATNTNSPRTFQNNSFINSSFPSSRTAPIFENSNLIDDQRKKDLSMLYDLYSKEKQNGNEFKSLQFLEEYISTFIRSIPENQLTAEELEHLRRLTEKFIVKCNVVAMDYLTNQRNKNMSKACLDKAKNIIDLYGRIVFKEEEEKGTKLLVSTLSNFSVFYKECGNLEKALNALNLAQKAETHFNASLELNFCAVLSQMNRHEEALNHGLEALRQLELFKKLNRIKHNIASCNETLIIAFYNVAVEYEHLKQTTSAMEYYSKGFSLSLEVLGTDHPTTKRLRESLEKFRSKNLVKNNASANTSIVAENASKLSARPSTLTSDSRGTHVRKVKPPSAGSSSTNSSQKTSSSGGSSSGNRSSDHFQESLSEKRRTQSTNLSLNTSTVSIPPTSKSTPPGLPQSVGSHNNSFRRSYRKAPNPPQKSIPLTENNLELHNKISSLHFYATLIQKVFRGFWTRKKLREERSIRYSYRPIKDVELMYETFLLNHETLCRTKLQRRSSMNRQVANVTQNEDKVHISRQHRAMVARPPSPPKVDMASKTKILVNDMTSTLKQLENVLKND